MKFSRGPLAGKGTISISGCEGLVGLTLTAQPAGDRGTGVRASRVEIQGRNHDRACEGEHRTGLGWIFLALRQRAKAWIEEGVRAQEE